MVLLAFWYHVNVKYWLERRSACICLLMVMFWFVGLRSAMNKLWNHISPFFSEKIGCVVCFFCITLLMLFMILRSLRCLLETRSPLKLIRCGYVTDGESKILKMSAWDLFSTELVRCGSTRCHVIRWPIGCFNF